MNGQVIELGLGIHQTGHTEVERLRGIVDRSLVLPCLDAGRSLVTQMQLRQVEGRNEISTIVAIGREAVSAVTIENKSLYGSLNQTTDRFAAVAQINDIRQIRHKLSPKWRRSSGEEPCRGEGPSLHLGSADAPMTAKPSGAARRPSSTAAPAEVKTKGGIIELVWRRSVDVQHGPRLCIPGDLWRE